VHVGQVLEVEAVVVRPECGVRLVLRGLLEACDLVRRQAARVERVHLAGLERLHPRRPVDDDLAVHARQRDVGGIAPVIPLHEVDGCVVLPRLELERAVGDDVLRIRPAVAELFDRGAVDGQERRVAHLLDEPGLRRRQQHLEGRVVESLDADLVGERLAVLLAGVVVGGADDPVKLVRVVRGQLGGDRPLPGVLEVLGRDRVAVRPLPVGAEVERDGLPILAHVPALRQARHRLQVIAELHQRIHDVQEDVGGGRVGRETRVERRRLGPPPDRDDLVRGLGPLRATARRSCIPSVARAAAACGREEGGREDRR
jgi:hypothetical protein